MVIDTSRFTRRGTAWATGVAGFTAAFTALGGAVVAPPALASDSPPVTYNVTVVNNSGQPASSVYVMLHGGNSADGTLKGDVPQPFSKLSTTNTFAFTMTTSDTSNKRLYVSYGKPVVWNEPAPSTTRYDKVEWTYGNYGAADATAVDFVGIGWALRSYDESGTLLGTSGYTAPMNTIKQSFQTLPGASKVVFNNPNPPNSFVRIVSPTDLGGGPVGASYATFGPYVRSMVGKSFRIKDAFYGSTFQLMDYTASTMGADGTFVMNGKLCNYGKAVNCRSASQWVAGPDFMVKGSDYFNSDAAVFGANVPYYTRAPYPCPAKPPCTNPNPWVAHTVVDVIPASNLERDYFAGLQLGWWNGDPGNGLPMNTINFDLYSPQHFGDAFPTKFFAAARAKHPTSYSTFNQYAATLFQYGNAYNFPFTDLLPGSAQPQIPSPAAGGTLKLTIPPDSASPLATRSRVASAAPAPRFSGTVRKSAGTSRTAVRVHSRVLRSGTDEQGRRVRSFLTFRTAPGGTPAWARLNLRATSKGGCRSLRAEAVAGHFGSGPGLRAHDFASPDGSKLPRFRATGGGWCGARVPARLLGGPGGGLIQFRISGTGDTRFFGHSAPASLRPELLVRDR